MPRLLPGYNSQTLSPPSTIAISTAFGLRAHSSPSFQPSGFISLLLLLAHSLTIDLYSSSPIPLYIYLGWGRPTGPPACKSTSRQTSSHSIPRCLSGGSILIVLNSQ